MKKLTITIPLITFVLMLGFLLFFINDSKSFILFLQIIFGVLFLIVIQFSSIIKNRLTFFLMLTFISAIFVSINLFLFNSVDGTLFEFNSTDGIAYHQYSQMILKMDVNQGIDFF